MARTTVFSRDTILDKAFDFVNEKGFDSLSARELGKYIGCSTQPLFKEFKNMDELKQVLIEKINDYYEKFIEEIIDEEEYLFTKNYAYILFALKEPNLFKALFLSDFKDKLAIGEWLDYNEKDENIETISKKMYISKKETRRLYRDVLFYSHGVACEISSSKLALSENDIKILTKNIIKQLNQYS